MCATTSCDGSRGCLCAATCQSKRGHVDVFGDDAAWMVLSYARAPHCMEAVAAVGGEEAHNTVSLGRHERVGTVPDA